MSAEASSLTFEQALSELEQIVQKLEAGDASLDDAINAYSRGIELKNQCQQRPDHPTETFSQFRP